MLGKVMHFNERGHTGKPRNMSTSTSMYVRGGDRLGHVRKGYCPTEMFPNITQPDFNARTLNILRARAL